MSGIEVDAQTLQAITGKLRDGTDAVEGIGASAPSSVDAGDLTAIIGTLLHDVTSTAASMAEGMHLAAEAVSASHESYEQAEAETVQTFAGRTGMGVV